MIVKWERMWGCIDNQDVGSEAAIIERVRNSSLVECPCAENPTGLNDAPKPRPAHSCARVGERSKGVEGMLEGILERLEERMPV